MAETLLIRADADAAIGCGHVMRCLALAQAWQVGGGTAVFVSAALPAGLEARLEREQIGIVRLDRSAADPARTVDLARDLNACCVVVDGYQLNGPFQAPVKDAGLKLLVIDDNGAAEHYRADLVLNQNLHATEHLYASREPDTRLLLGPRYVLLRKEFCATPQRDFPARDAVANLLITLGGSDPSNRTAVIIRNLNVARGIRVKVILGPGNRHRQEVETVIRESRHPIELLTDVTSMNEVMSWADLAITSGGVTLLELAFLGVPAIAFSQGPQETIAVQAAESQGLCISGGPLDEVSEATLARAMLALSSLEARRAMTASQQRTLDGQGARRVVAEIRKASVQRPGAVKQHSAMRASEPIRSR